MLPELCRRITWNMVISMITPLMSSSFSAILTLSPIRYGNEKNINTLAVRLLKIDHCANKATPSTANIEDKNSEISALLRKSSELNQNRTIRSETFSY